MRSLTGVWICCLVLAFSAIGQEPRTDCKDLTYENHNPTDNAPFQVSRIRGIAQDAQRLPIDACLGIFTEAEHTLIATAGTDDTGHFDLTGIPDGNYRLVVKSSYTGFCPANAKLQIDRRVKTKKTLTVEMRAAGSDTCSWIEMK
jgi:hypothetical protein